MRAVLDRVRGGSTLADAMAAQNGMFPAYYVGMVRAGEASGSLDTTLRHLAELLERADAAREQVKSALIYPMLVLATGAGSIAILFGFVIPRFRPLFDGAGTRHCRWRRGSCSAISDCMQNYGLLALVAVLLLGAAVAARISRTPRGPAALAPPSSEAAAARRAGRRRPRWRASAARSARCCAMASRRSPRC